MESSCPIKVGVRGHTVGRKSKEEGGMGQLSPEPSFVSGQYSSSSHRGESILFLPRHYHSFVNSMIQAHKWTPIATMEVRDINDELKRTGHIGSNSCRSSSFEPLLP
jgi:hypothetical protein